MIIVKGSTNLLKPIIQYIKEYLLICLSYTQPFENPTETSHPQLDAVISQTKQQVTASTQPGLTRSRKAEEGYMLADSTAQPRMLRGARSAGMFLP
jgi:hypothetical protein